MLYIWLMKKILLAVFLSIKIVAFAQNDAVFRLDSLPNAQEYTVNDPGLIVLTSWKYHKGDDIRWADPNFEDQSWIFVAPELNFDSMPKNTFENIAWFRLHIAVDTSFVDKTLALLITHSGASEIYLDGKLIHSFGKIDTKNSANEERYDPQEVPVDIRFEKTRSHVLAIRYANSTAMSDYKNRNVTLGGFNLKFAQIREAIVYKYVNSNIITAIFIFYFTFFIALSFLHFTFFLFYRTNKSNLYYSIFAGAFGTYFLSLVISKNFMFPDFVTSINQIANTFSDFYMPALLAMLYSIFYKKMPKIFWLWIILFGIDLLLAIFYKEVKQLGYLLSLIFIIESLRIIIASIYKKQEGSWILGSGIITTVGFFALFFILSISGVRVNFNSQGGWSGLFFGLLVIYVTLSIPLSMTIYLARDFSKTSKNLEKKLIEVESLSAKSMEQEKEKQKILEAQKEMLEVQVKERTTEIVEQKKVIEEKNKDITDSINYAKRIQEAILPDQKLLPQIFSNAAILFKPKDIVSGDFYWFGEKDGKKIIIAADCTGHGVPGSLMSMIGSNILSHLIVEKAITKPNEILNNLHKEIRIALKQNDEKTETRDGMDIAIVSIENNILQYAGAQRPLWIIKNNKLEEIKANKFSIGGIQHEEERVFTNHTFNLEKDDCIYIFSDGYADQFGGETGKKFMTKNFKQLLVNINEKNILEQKEIVNKTIKNWKSATEQVDDILVIGIKI